LLLNGRLSEDFGRLLLLLLLVGLLKWWVAALLIPELLENDEVIILWQKVHQSIVLLQKPKQFF
jgi:hypothetical protein